MNIISIICLALAIIVLVVTLLLSNFCKKFDEDKSEEGYVCFCILIVAFVASLVANKFTEEPKTIDVYRGKTQLVLDYNTDGTYDSIVVWKGGKK